VLDYLVAVLFKESNHDQHYAEDGQNEHAELPYYRESDADQRQKPGYQAERYEHYTEYEQQ
jgi:hypothetical protein